MQQQFSLDGKTALVTGAGRGLGRAIALALADAGAELTIVARTQSQVEQTAELVRAKGRRCLAVVGDVTDSVSVAGVANEVLDRFGHIDILVNNAGGLTGGFVTNLPDITDSAWRTAIDTNLTGAFYYSRAVIPHMVRRGRGKIINVGSTAGLRGTNNFAYAAAKGALINFTRSLALTYGRAIQANVIVPGVFPHGIAAIEKMFEHGNLVPIGRLGEDDEVGCASVVLASDAAPYMSGAILALDGGTLVGGQAPTGFAPAVPLAEAA